MASEVDIANLALAHLGDNATVASLEPPEGSAQAEHCARFYPMARDALLELHTWGFATRRAVLAQLPDTVAGWTHAYEAPGDTLNVIAVMPPDAADDYSVSLGAAGGVYTPQPFVMESDAHGRAIIYTNQAQAVLRYTAFVTDTTRFSPLFVETLSWKLAAMLAGPILKGDTGAAEAKRCEAMAAAKLSQAMVSDANQRRVQPVHSVPWMANR